MPRYVVLEHDWPVLHWDFMLESGEVLRTWRLAAPPRPGASVAAESLGDHRRAYLDYEGPVSGGRGTVTRWDAGTFSWEAADEGVAVWLDGARLRGRARIEADGAGGWRLVMETATASPPVPG
jgi:hypothetical protein